MALTKKVLSFDDFEEINLDNAPSLDLPDLQIDHFLMPKSRDNIMLFLASVKPQNIDFECPYCKKKTAIIRAGRAKPRLVHDVIRNNYRVDIAILPQMFRCTECEQRFTQPIPGIVESRQMTIRLYEYLKKESFLQLHSDLAESSGFSVETIQNIMDEQIEVFEQQRKKNPPKAPRVLGIDEKHITQKMRGTLVDVEQSVLIEMLEDNKAKTMQNAIKSLDGWDTNIKVVTTDMNNSYIKWLKDLLPDAEIVIDRFHVIKDIQKRISKTQFILYNYRKSLIMEIDDLKERQRQLNILKIVNENRFLFKTSIDTIERDTGDKAEKLATVMSEFPEYEFLRALYSMIEEMYKSETLKEAEEYWEKWQNYLPPAKEKEYIDWCETYGYGPSLFEPFKSFTRENFKFYKPYILNYFKEGCRYTNAATEGINNRIERISRTCYGCRFKHLRAKALYAPLFESRTIYSIDLKTIKKWIPTSSFMTSWSFGGGGTYTAVKQYVFSTTVKNITVNPKYVYNGDSDELIEIYYYDTSTEAIPKIDEESILSSEQLRNMYE